MTDTARTLAAIKALFADNGAGAISAQDGRDLIESIVNPVAGGGFERNVAANTLVAYRRNVTGLDGMYDTYDKSAVSTLPPQNDRIFDWRGTAADTTKRLYDPAGWLNAAPIADSGWWGTGSYPAGTVLELDAGMYVWEFLAQIDTPLTAGTFSFYLDRITDPASAGTALMRAVPGFGDGLSIEENLTGVLAFTAGSYVCDEPTLVIADLFGYVTMNVAKKVTTVRMSLARVA